MKCSVILSGRCHIIDRPLKGAIAGFGKVAELAHLPAWQNRPEFRVVAVADPLPERRDRCRALLPQIRLYTDMEALFLGEPELDFVDICTPPHAHTPLVLAALKRGLHVLCEKPLTLSPGEWRQLNQAMARSSKALVTVHNWKYAPLLSLSLEQVQAGAIGSPRKLTWEVHRTSSMGGGLSSWRQDPANSLGGILVDHGWHAFYLLMAWAGGEPRAVKARLLNTPGAGAEVEAEVDIEFSTCKARLFLTWQAPQRSNRGRLEGDSDEIILADDQLIRTSKNNIWESYHFPEKLSAGSHHPQWMAGVLREFLEEILDAGIRGRNFREAEICSRLIRLAYDSHQAGGKWLSLTCP